MSIDDLRFDESLLTPPPPAGLTISTTLAHFALITYWVEPAALRRHVHPRFEITTRPGPAGQPAALISVVPFIDQDFHFRRAPWARWRFGQTNYRAYVRDRATGEHVVWFFGTVLDSWTVAIPRYLWRMPWQRGRLRFRGDYDAAAGRYRHYEMTAAGRYAPARLRLADSGAPPVALAGFDRLEAGLVLLTHPLRGFYYRRDGRLGGYHIWHDRLTPTTGRVETAYLPLLARLDLVPPDGWSTPHSVLLQRETVFTVYVPPVVVD